MTDAPIVIDLDCPTRFAPSGIELRHWIEHREGDHWQIHLRPHVWEHFEGVGQQGTMPCTLLPEPALELAFAVGVACLVWLRRRAP